MAFVATPPLSVIRGELAVCGRADRTLRDLDAQVLPLAHAEECNRRRPCTHRVYHPRTTSALGRTPVVACPFAQWPPLPLPPPALPRSPPPASPSLDEAKRLAMPIANGTFARSTDSNYAYMAWHSGTPPLRHLQRRLARVREPDPARGVRDRLPVLHPAAHDALRALAGPVHRHSHALACARLSRARTEE